MRPSFQNILLTVIVALSVIVGAILRVSELDSRPMHTDEAIQAYRLGELLEGNGFDYNPKDGHGPGLLFFSMPIIWTQEAKNFQDLDEITLRLSPAIFGIALIAAALLFRQLIGTAGVAAAAMLTALSPMHVYYSRYYIMELPMVFFLALFLFCVWRYFCHQKCWWMIGAGLSCALMHATKETFVLSVAALVTAAVIIFIWEEITKRQAARLDSGQLIRHTVIGIGLALLTSASLYSLLFTNAQAISQSFEAYRHYLIRAEGSGHEKPFWYYLELLSWKKMELYTWSELLIMGLATVGAGAAFLRRDIPVKQQIFLRVISIYIFLTLLIYSAIAYKTPWSILSFLHASILLAGYGFSILLRSPSVQKSNNPAWIINGTLILAFTFGCWKLYDQDRIANFKFPANADRNPYVYSHTSPSLVSKLVAQVEELKEIEQDLSVSVFHPETGWPLPYYFRHIKRAGYWTDVSFPVTSDVIIADALYDEKLTSKLGDRYIGPDLMNLRDNVMLHVYIEKELFFKMVNRRSKPNQ